MVMIIYGVCGVLLIAGCQDPASSARIARRGQNLTKTVRAFGEIEEGRPRGLAWAVNSLREQNEKDLKNSAENPGRVGRMIQEDFDRWQGRQPAYNEFIQNELKGDPESIRRTAPQMAW